MSKTITFYSRFSHDIKAGLKTITIRDESESHFQVGDQLQAYTNPENEFIAELEVTHIAPVQIDQLTETHARQENMSLDELRKVIREIYPDQTSFYVIEFIANHK